MDSKIEMGRNKQNLNQREKITRLPRINEDTGSRVVNHKIYGRRNRSTKDNSGTREKRKGSRTKNPKTQGPWKHNSLESTRLNKIRHIT